MEILSLIKSVSCQSCMNRVHTSDTPPHQVCRKKNKRFIDFNKPGSSFSRKNYLKLITVDEECVIFDTLFQFM